MSAAGGSRGRDVQGWLGLLARLALGWMLLVAGLPKVTDPAPSAGAALAALAARADQLLPYGLAGHVGYAPPVPEVGVSMLVLAGLLTGAAAVAGGVHMRAFLVGIGSPWAGGLSTDCGCSGGAGTVAVGQTHYLSEMLRGAGLLAGATYLVLRPRSPWGQDGRPFGDGAPAPGARRASTV